ncbi:MAG: RHS repeat-associated core domain-containing protein [Acidimicrobiales bacterium]|nr:RHS repeat-associated core domain-containing protein [Acidimicrobiales bacterium]
MTVTTKAGFDAAGRQISSTDGRGTVTSIGLDASFGYPKTSTVAGLTTTVEQDPGRGVPVLETDANGHQTRTCWDNLGRVTMVLRADGTTTRPGTVPVCSLDQWAVNRPKFAWYFEYDVPTWNATWTSRPITRVYQNQTIDPGADVTSLMIDGFGRVREQQATSVAANTRVVTGTFYNARGAVARQSRAVDKAGAPYYDNLALAYPTATELEERYGYDHLQRPTAAVTYSNQPGSPNIFYQWATTTVYDGLITTVTAPSGMVTSTRRDSYGRDWQITENNAEPGINATTTMTYTARGEIDLITDTRGNVINNDYDLAGRRTQLVDPDQGTSLYTYDANNNLIKTRNAAGQWVDTAYDALNRPCYRKDGTQTSTLTCPTSAPAAGTVGAISFWQYDRNAAQGNTTDVERGLLDKSYTYADSRRYEIDVAGYDNRNRPLGRSWVIPTAETGLGGTYGVTYGYNYADLPTTVTYGQIGGANGLPAEVVTTSYTTAKLPQQLSSPVATYATNSYDSKNRLTNRTHGSGANTFTRTMSYDSAYRIATMTGTINTTPTATIVQSDTITYVGNTPHLVETITDNSTGGQAPGGGQKQCFTYDQRDRLTRAWTAGTATCNFATPNPNYTDTTGNPAPYDQAWSTDRIGNTLTRTDRTPTATTSTYCYNASGAGSTRPHAPNRVITSGTCATGGTTYNYNANGSMTTGGTNNMAWDTSNRLCRVTTTANPTCTTTGGTSMVYDPDGQRLIRRDATGTIIYLEGQEYRRPSTGNPVITRYYSVAGTTIAARNKTVTTSGTNTLNWIAGDRTGSATLTIQAGTTTTQRQRYKPYGNPRGTTNTAFNTITERGWIGQTKDNTGLNYLNNRYYNPDLNKFISVDPILDLNNPRTLNPYAYAGNNPTSYSDPTGLCYGLADAASLGIDLDNVAGWCSNDGPRDASGSVVSTSQAWGGISEGTINILDAVDESFSGEESWFIPDDYYEWDGTSQRDYLSDLRSWTTGTHNVAERGWKAWFSDRTVETATKYRDRFGTTSRHPWDNGKTELLTIGGCMWMCLAVGASGTGRIQLTVGLGFAVSWPSLNAQMKDDASFRRGVSEDTTAFVEAGPAGAIASIQPGGWNVDVYAAKSIAGALGIFKYGGFGVTHNWTWTF